MYVRHSRLTPEARQHFKIVRDPFIDELRSSADVFDDSDDIRYVRAAVRQTALHGGMLAVVGDSGAGKSTIRKDLQEWINTSDEPIEVIEPYVVNTSSASAGRPLVAADITGAVIRNLAPGKALRASLESRTDQMHGILKDSARAGRKHVVIIEEAHDLAVPTLKAMKRFYELEDGFRKLLAIILVGQNELARKLSEKDPEVREVVQRCELITLPPLDNNLSGYLQHKFKRVNANMTAVLEPDAIDAIRAVLRRAETRTFGGKRITDEVSKCHPLAVNNLVTRAMNQAVLIGAPKVNAALINAAFRSGGDA